MRRPRRGQMDIVLAAVVAAAVAGIVVVAGQRRSTAAAATAGPAAAPSERRREAADASVLQATATAPASTTVPEVRVAVPTGDAGLASELQARRAEIARIEERLLSKEEAL